MSDPRFTDPRLTEPPRDDMRGEMRDQRLGELEQSNTMWGWIAGGVVLALLLVFIFGRGPNPTDTASTQMNQSPPATTGMAPRGPAPSAPTDQAQRPAPSAPSTTGQGGSSSQ
jgi:hypothetical protein